MFVTIPNWDPLIPVYFMPVVRCRYNHVVIGTLILLTLVLADIKMKGVVPGPIMNYISKAALKQATSWVKKESEKQYGS
jgi:hypothetical protein